MLCVIFFFGDFYLYNILYFLSFLKGLYTVFQKKIKTNFF